MYRLNYFITIFIIYFGLIKVVSTDSIIVISKSLQTDESRSTELSHEIFRSSQDGIFVKFVRSYLHLLQGITGSKIRNYCRIVNRHLRDLGYSYTRRLARIFKGWADDDSIAEDIEKYQRELDKNLPHRTEFLEAMNQVFTLQQAVLFDDYLYDLTNYGNGLKQDVNAETRKLFKNVIVNNIEQLSKTDKKDLEKKLKKAIKEYEKYELRDYMKEIKKETGVDKGFRSSSDSSSE